MEKIVAIAEAAKAAADAAANWAVVRPLAYLIGGMAHSGPTAAVVAGAVALVGIPALVVWLSSKMSGRMS